MPATVKHKLKGEPMWSVERAEDCRDDFLVIPLDHTLYVTIRVEPYNPQNPVDSATFGYAQLICNLLNSGVNDGNWKLKKPKTKKAKKRG